MKITANGTGYVGLVTGACLQKLATRSLNLQFSIVSDFEFLNEGAAVDDFMRPDRIVVGSEDEQATHIMRWLCAPFTRNHPKLLVMDIASAELTSSLRTRCSRANQLHE